MAKKTYDLLFKLLLIGVSIFAFKLKTEITGKTSLRISIN